MTAMLRVGQIVRMGEGLYRVDYVNSCRARIVPLPKSALGGRQLEVGSAMNISPDAGVDIVEDVQRALDELELAAAERELRELRREITMPVPEAQAIVRPTTLGDSRRYMRWFVGPKESPVFKPGTLAEKVMAFIVAHPGQTTVEIVENVVADGAVAACVSRFNQAGLIHKG